MSDPWREEHAPAALALPAGWPSPDLPRHEARYEFVTATNASAYELSRLTEHMGNTAGLYPHSPAVHALRAAAVARLMWDRPFRSCWNDPAWRYRYEGLRALIVTIDRPLGAQIEVAAVLDELTAITSLAATLENHP